MLLLRDGFLLFHTFFRLYNAGQMFFGGASSKATPRPTRLCRVGLGVLWVERTGTVLNYLLLHEAVRLLLQLSDETECGRTKKVLLPVRKSSQGSYGCVKDEKTTMIH